MNFFCWNFYKHSIFCSISGVCPPGNYNYIMQFFAFAGDVGFEAFLTSTKSFNKFFIINFYDIWYGAFKSSFHILANIIGKKKFSGVFCHACYSCIKILCPHARPTTSQQNSINLFESFIYIFQEFDFRISDFSIIII